MAQPDAARGERGGDVLAEARARSLRIRNAELAVLYRGAFAIPTNFLVGGVVAWCLADSFPFPLLATWFVVNVAVAVARLYLHHRFSQATAHGAAGGRWDVLYTLGSLSSGLLWAGLCLLLPRYGTPDDYILLTLVSAGMTAGALTTLISFYPAYLAYALSFLTPMAYVSAISADPHISANGPLILLYLAMISIAGKKLNRSVAGTIALQVDNETLNTSLTHARSERDAARKDKWLMLGQLSHELRTPLNAILGFSEAMSAQLFGPLGDAHYAEYSGHVQTSGQYLLNLVNELLELSQGETGRLSLSESELDLAELCTLTVAELDLQAAAKSIAIINALGADAPALYADGGKLRRILHNIIGNAVKFAPSTSRVLIGGAIRQDGDFDLVIHDTGVGMSAEQIAIALEPFGRVADAQTRTTGGLGLGLPIARHFAELHGGTLAIDSAPGQGTTCILTLPAWRLRPPRALAAGDIHIAAGA